MEKTMNEARMKIFDTEMELVRKADYINKDSEEIYEYAANFYKEAVEMIGDDVQLLAKIFNRFANMQPLTSITDYDEFVKVTDDSSVDGALISLEQCVRYPALFKATNIETHEVRYRNMDCIAVIDVNQEKYPIHQDTKAFVNIFFNDVLNPIYLPYFPMDNKYIAMTEAFAVYDESRKRDIDDTLCIWEIRGLDRIWAKPIFFKRTKEGMWVDIDEQEYRHRRQQFTQVLKNAVRPAEAAEKPGEYVDVKSYDGAEASDNE